MDNSRPDNTGKKQAQRTTKGTFVQGVSGNSQGRPKGSLNKTTLAAQSLLDNEAEALTRKAVEMALAGNVAALKLCIERLLPPAKERGLQPLDLPEITGRKTMPDFINAVLQAVANSELTTKEAEALLRIGDKLREAQKDGAFGIF